MGSLHESFAERRAVRGATDRSFGLTVGGILLAIGIVRLFDGTPAIPIRQMATLALLAVGAVLAGVAMVHAAWLAPLNRLWTGLGLAMGKIVNPLVMLMIFAVAFVPLALAMRLAGRDALAFRWRRDGRRRSDWIVRSPPGPAADTMINQY